MKKQKITYGVYNMVEWHALLRSGKATLEVHFANGATTTAGVTPATFTTDNPITQLMIERTAEFRNGKIVRLRAYDLGGSVVGQKNPPAPAVPTPAPAPAPAEKEEPAEEPILEEAEEQEAEAEEAAPAPAPAEEEEPAAPAEETKEGEVKVASLADARIYLEENFDYTPNQIRTTAQIKAAASQHGFVFVGI